MSTRGRLLAVLAHPDDESLGMGGTLAKYAAEGVEVFLVTATRGDAQHPGAPALGSLREAELRAAAGVLGVQEVTVLDYQDQHLDSADPRQMVERLAAHLRRIRPDVVITFGPDGGYGHPDHIAISQFTTAAIVGAGPNSASKLYYLAWPQSTYDAYQAAVGTLSATVDGVERYATPWPEWAITTAIDTSDVWTTVWRAVSCHESQLAGYQRLRGLPPDLHRSLWGRQSYYRAFSLVNGGRARETDLFEGVDR